MPAHQHNEIVLENDLHPFWKAPVVEVIGLDPQKSKSLDDIVTAIAHAHRFEMPGANDEQDPEEAMRGHPGATGPVDLAG